MATEQERNQVPQQPQESRERPSQSSAASGQDAPRHVSRDNAQQTRKSRARLRVLAGVAALALVAILFAVVMAVMGDEAKEGGPTVAVQVQQQQRLIDQLRDEIEGLQQARAERNADAQQLDTRLDALGERLEAREAYSQDLERQQLPDAVASLSERLASLSRSVDARFNLLEPESVLPAIFSAPTRSDDKSTDQDDKAEPKPKPKPTRRYTPPSPPFSVSGVEMRGGQRYLAIMVGSAGHLRDMRLVGEGQRIAGWRLSAIHSHSAAFIVNGRTVVVRIP
nr:hypothetical protein [uncultured Halomonas sp.]